MKNKKICLALLLGVFLVSMISASQSFLGTFKQNDCIDLTQTCASCSYNNITSIIYPNGTKILFAPEQNMSKTGTEYLFNTCNYSALTGNYKVNGHGDLAGTDTVWNYGYSITPSGIAPSESRTQAMTRSIYFLFIPAILLFIAFLFVQAKPPVKWSFLLLSIMFFLQTINILFVGLQEEVINPKIEGYFSFLTTASFILFWFAFGLMAIMWFLTFFQTMLLKKNKRTMEKYK